MPEVAGSSPVIHPIRTTSSVRARTAEPLTAEPDTGLDEATELRVAPDVPWTTVVWNDPVNLMSYVARVFRTYFGYPDAEAQRLMMAVHREGRATVATGPREEMERHTEAMHEYGLWATIEKAGG